MLKECQVTASMENNENIDSDVSTKAIGPKAVGGWLLLLIVGLIFLRPIFGGLQVFDLFDFMTGYQRSVFVILSILTYTLTIRAGYLLLTLHQVSSVTTAVRTLWVTGPLMFSLLAVLLLFDQSRSTSALLGREFAGGLIPTAFWAIVWTLYLKKSKRVKYLYKVPTDKKNSTEVADSLSQLTIQWNAPPAETKDSLNKFAIWWKTLPTSVRKWIFCCFVWIFACFIYVDFLKPYGSMMSSSETRQLLGIMFIPPAFFSFAYYVYKKWII